MPTVEPSVVETPVVTSPEVSVGNAPETYSEPVAPVTMMPEVETPVNSENISTPVQNNYETISTPSMDVVQEQSSVPGTEVSENPVTAPTESTLTPETTIQSEAVQNNFNQTVPVIENAPGTEEKTEINDNKTELPKVSKQVKIICTVVVVAVALVILYFVVRNFFLVK